MVSSVPAARWVGERFLPAGKVVCRKEGRKILPNAVSEEKKGILWPETSAQEIRQGSGEGQEGRPAPQTGAKHRNRDPHRERGNAWGTDQAACAFTPSKREEREELLSPQGRKKIKKTTKKARTRGKSSMRNRGTQIDLTLQRGCD